MVSFTDINARLASVWAKIANIQIVVDKIYTFLDTLATHTMSPLLHPPSHQRYFRDIKRGMA